MKKLLIGLMVVMMTLMSMSLFAKTKIQKYSIANALNTEQARELNFGHGVKFYFGNQKHGAVAENFGKISSRKKTNGFMKQDRTACRWVFYSTLKDLRAKARKLGANAVINIHSNYDGVSSDTKNFTCAAGFLMAGVGLEGEAVRLK